MKEGFHRYPRGLALVVREDYHSGRWLVVRVRMWPPWVNATVVDLRAAAEFARNALASFTEAVTTTGEALRRLAMEMRRR